MPVEVAPAVETPKPFDAKAFIEARNAKPPAPGMPQAEAPPKPAPAAKTEAAAPVTIEKPKDDDEAEHETRVPRSVRRELNKLRNEAAEARGRLAAYQELQAAGATRSEAMKATGLTSAEIDANVEPKREQFQTDADYYRALARFDFKAELAKGSQTAAQDAQQREFMDSVGEATKKFQADVANFPDWAEAQEAMEDVQIDTKEQLAFVALIAQSDQRAAMLYHFSKHTDELEAMFKLSPNNLIKAFHRLEGRVESLYAKKPSEAAQASGETSEDRTTPEKPVKGAQTAAERDVRKPKPSAEVAAHGGSAPPETPVIGSAAWLAMRNRLQFGK